MTLVLSLAVLVPLAFIGPSEDVAANEASSALEGVSPARISAEFAVRAARSEARADFLQALASAIHDDEQRFETAFQEAFNEFHEALILANAQNESRIAMIERFGNEAYRPEYDEADFSAHINHPYFPLVIGRTLVYEKATDEGLETTRITVLNETRTIDGVECRAVKETTTVGEKLEEETIDWFSQDKDGSVWFFGELSKEFEDGYLSSIDGSWLAGQDGAQPGIIMPATPLEGLAYRQEYNVNSSEDFAEILLTSTRHVGPTGRYDRCLMTFETSVLCPGAGEQKIYAPGLGLIAEIDEETGETLELVEIITK